MMPMPNHCIECDIPIVSAEVLKKELVFICDKCKEKEDNIKVCGGCGEVDPVCYCDMAPADEEPMSNCCSAPFTYPGFPDSDVCSKCKEHADIWEEEDE